MGYEYVKDRVIGVQRRREISPVHDLVAKRFLVTLNSNETLSFYMYDLGNIIKLYYLQ